MDSIMSSYEIENEYTARVKIYGLTYVISTEGLTTEARFTNGVLTRLDGPNWIDQWGMYAPDNVADQLEAAYQRLVGGAR